MAGLRDPAPEGWPVGEPVAVDHRDPLEVAGQDPGRQQPGHPGAQHNSVGALPADGVVAAVH